MFKIRQNFILGVLISGYIVRDGNWILVGQADPRQPNAFFPIHNNITIKKNDLLVRIITANNRANIVHLLS